MITEFPFTTEIPHVYSVRNFRQDPNIRDQPRYGVTDGAGRVDEAGGVRPAGGGGPTGRRSRHWATIASLRDWCLRCDGVAGGRAVDGAEEVAVDPVPQEDAERQLPAEARGQEARVMRDVDGGN